MIKIVHHLTFKFQNLYIDWIEREKNSVADLFSRYASKPRFLSEKDDLFRIFFSL
jgi:hypothetical protein